MGGPNSRIVWSAGHQQAEVVALPVVVKVNAVRADVADIGDPICEAADQSAWAERRRSRDKSRRPPDRGLSGSVQGFVQRVA